MRSYWKWLVAIVVILAVGSVIYIKTRPQPVVPPVVVETVKKDPEIRVIGKSVEGRDISSYTYGSGKHHIVFVGGIHGGYEWNSVLLAYEFMDYIKANPDFIPENVKVTVVPSANPDAVVKVVGKEGRFEISDVSKDSKLLASARFNANNVDLNRNFDCKWQPKSTWQKKTVSAGTSAFSEPEAQAIQKITQEKPTAFVFWHSASNAVYASECKNGILPQTLDIMNVYAKAAGYNAVKSFDSYAITGDAEGWLASINIPAVTVELKSHDSVEWDKNLKGITALLDYYKLK